MDISLMADGIQSNSDSQNNSIRSAMRKSIETQTFKNSKNENLFENSNNEKKLEELREKIGYTRADVESAKAKQKSLLKEADLAKIDGATKTNDGEYARNLGRREKDEGVKDISLAIKYFTLAHQLQSSGNQSDRVQGDYLQGLGETTQASGESRMTQGDQYIAQGAGLMTSGTLRTMQGIMLEHAGESNSSDVMKGMAALQIMNGQLSEASAAIITDNLGDKIDPKKEYQAIALGLGTAFVQDTLENSSSSPMGSGDFNIMSGSGNATKYAIKSGVRLGTKAAMDGVGAGSFVTKEMADGFSNSIIAGLEGGPEAQVAMAKSMFDMAATTWGNLSDDVKEVTDFIQDSGALDITIGVAMNHDASFREGLSKLSYNYISEEATPFIVNADHILNTAKDIAISGQSPISVETVSGTVNYATDTVTGKNNPLLNRDRGQAFNNNIGETKVGNPRFEETVDRDNPATSYFSSITTSQDARRRTNQLS